MFLSLSLFFPLIFSPFLHCPIQLGKSFRVIYSRENMTSIKEKEVAFVSET